MKKILFCFLLFSPLVSFSQARSTIIIDTVRFVTPDIKQTILDQSVTDKLEPFKNKDDAIVYIYRLRDIVGCAVPWSVKAEGLNDHLWQRQYVVLHIDTKKKNHWIAHKYFSINYIDFKPNTYYAYRLKGFAFYRGYLNEQSFKEIETCRKTKKSQAK